MYRRHLTSSDERSEENDQDTMNVHNPFLDNSEMDNEIKNDSEASLLRGASEGNMGEPDYRGYYSRQGSQVPLVGQQRNLNVGQDQQGGNQSGPTNQQRLSPGRPATPAGISNNDIMSPQAFDRYPTVGSRAVSMALNPTQPAGRRGAHHAQGQNGHGGSTPGIGSSGSDQISLSSMASSNPFVGDQDFSPFGGYPASSFPLLLNEKEDDDYLHNPDPEEEARLDKGRFLMDLKYMDKRAAGGLFGFIFLFVGALLLFVVLPTLTYTGAMEHKKGSELEVLSLYQYPQLSAIRTDLVDPNTPSTARKRKALDGSDWILVFSDEFNAVGRTFYEGEDQFWTAPDIHYSATNDLEWYTPDASTTKDGVLQFRMDAFLNHNMYYRSGMLQSWNKLCFTQGALEISANLPNYGNILGLWPGLWTMGNLGRPGYLSTTEGVWPYAYDSCDAGITPNQSSYDGISFLPGQKLSACTCDGEDHPNLGVGRGAPEIDVIEGSVNDKLGVGIVSQSAQIAPFDIWYIPDYEYIEIYNQSITTMNTYCGGPFQQAVSAVSTLNNAWYEFGINSGYFQKYAIEYLNHNTKGYIRWFVGDEPTFTIYASALHPNGNVGWRRISKEPMSIIMNMGISNNWAYIDWQMIFFPVTMSVDYVRLYQPVDAVSVTCDPPGYPTYKYIQDHLGAYMNPNLTSWEDAGYSFPKNKLTGNCVASKYKEPTD